MITPASVRVRLEDARRQGFAVADGDLATGFGALGVPIFDHRGRVAAAISISGPRDAILGDETVASRASGMADEVSRSLGYSEAIREHA